MYIQLCSNLRLSSFISNIIIRHPKVLTRAQSREKHMCFMYRPIIFKTENLLCSGSSKVLLIPAMSCSGVALDNRIVRNRTANTAHPQVKSSHSLTWLLFASL